MTTENKAGGRYKPMKEWTTPRKFDYEFYKTALLGSDACAEHSYITNVTKSTDTELLEIISCGECNQIDTCRKYTAYRNQKLLDVGCGQGQFRDLLKIFDYYGFDIRPSEWAKIQGDFTKVWPIEDKMFDIVMLSNILEHTPDPWLMVKESFRVLKDDGIVVGSVPFYAEVHEEPYDFLRYTDIMLEKLFTEAGFKKVEVTPLGTPFKDYKWMQGKFLKQLDKSLASRIFIRATLYLQKILRKTLEKPKQNRKYCRRYGFVVHK